MTTRRSPGRMTTPALHVLVLIAAITFDRVSKVFFNFGTVPGVCGSEFLLIIASLPFLTDGRRREELFGGGEELKGKTAFWVLTLALSAYPFIMLANGFFLNILADMIPLPDHVGALFHGSRSLPADILFFAVIPGVCEEIFFRGVLLSHYRCHGKLTAVALSGFLFALFHFNVQNFLTPLLLGLLLGSIVWWTGSVIYAMEAHIIHNVVGILFLRNFTPESIRKLQGLAFVEQLGSVERAVIVVLIISCICSLFFFYWSYLALSRGYRRTYEKIKLGEPLNVFLGFLPIGLLILYYCIVVFN